MSKAFWPAWLATLTLLGIAAGVWFFPLSDDLYVILQFALFLLAAFGLGAATMMNRASNAEESPAKDWEEIINK